MNARRTLGAMCLALVLAFGLFATPASAQTVKAFQIERQLILPFLLTTIMPNPKLVDPAILAAVAAGQLEIRERLAYDPVGQTIASTTFLVFAGSPLPTPPAVDVSHQTIAYFVLVVGDPVFSTQPFPSVLFTGTIADNPGGTPFGDYHGAASFVSFGYTKDTPTKLNNVLCVIAGATIAYSPSAAGSVVIQ